MSKVALDLKDFKHVSSDEHTCTLEHKQGHRLQLALGGLSTEAKAQLQALAEAAKTVTQKAEAKKEKPHGKVTVKEDKPQPNGNVTVKDTPEQPVGKVKMMADGGGVPAALAPNQPTDVATYATPDISAGGQTPIAPVQVDPKMQATRDIYNNLVGANAQTFGPNGEIDTDSQLGMMFGRDGSPPSDFQDKMWEQAKTMQEQSAADQVKASQADAEKLKYTNEQRISAGLPPVAMPEGAAMSAPPQAAQPQMPMQQPQAAPQASGAPGMDSTEGMLRQGYNERLKGINAEAQAAGDLGKATADIRAKALEAQQHAQAAYQDQVTQLTQEREGLIHDIKDGFVSPEKYWTGDPKTGEGGHSRLMAGIGMILAGFNPTNSPNAAIDYIKHQMDKNLEAQAKNLDAKNNLLSANMHQFGNLRDAATMTRVMQMDMMANQLDTAAAQATSPLAQAKASQAAGQLRMEAAPMFQQFAMRRAMMHMADQGTGGDPSNTAGAEHMLNYMRVMNPAMAKEMEERLVPGVGMAQIPVPKEARDKLRAHKDFDNAAKDLEQFTKTHTTLIPGTADYTTGEQKAMELQAKVREGLLNTVYREGEQPLLDKMIKGNPANLLKNFNTLPQLKELVRSNNAQLNTLKESYKLPVQKTQVQDPRAQAQAWLQANPNDPRAAKIRQALGVK